MVNIKSNVRLCPLSLEEARASKTNGATLSRWGSIGLALSCAASGESANLAFNSMLS